MIGFIAGNQYFTTSNRQTTVLKYDNWIVVPYIEKDLAGCMEAGRTNLFTSRIVASFFVCEPQNLAAVRDKIDSLLEKYGFDNMFDTFKCRIEKELADNFKDQLVISITVCVASLLFSLFSFIFTMLYKIGNNMKNYAIRMVVGETYGEITLRYLLESFAVFLLGQLTGFFCFNVYFKIAFMGYEHIESQTLKAGVLLNILFYTIN